MLKFVPTAVHQEQQCAHAERSSLATEEIVTDVEHLTARRAKTLMKHGKLEPLRLSLLAKHGKLEPLPRSATAAHFCVKHKDARIIIFEM